MTIQLNHNDIELKTQAASLLIQDRQLNGRSIANPGEYEIANLGTRVFEDGIMKISGEGLQLAYFDRAVPAHQQVYLDELAECEVVIVQLASNKLSLIDAQKTIQAIEPKIIVLADHELRDKFCQLIGGQLELVKTLKITKNQLLTDVNQRIVGLS